jgi:hypothetical protein
MPLVPRGDRPAPLVFKQGARAPYGIRWYGITSLYGHMRNFMARAIAAESVDSRDWMRPNPPEDLLAAACRTLSVPPGPSLAEALGRPVWIDFAADTGDDRDVSAAVGKMVSNVYTVNGRLLPRGDMLLFGGDISYPVATADEIHSRLILPWNESLRELRSSHERRVLLGVPGNHDWYDGLDGFGRLLRRRVDEPLRTDHKEPRSRLSRGVSRRRGRKLGLVARGLHLDEVGEAVGFLPRIFKSVRAFFRGVALRRRRRLALRGYEPIQEASYFVLPLAHGLELWGADRQLGRVDFRQRSFFKKHRNKHPNARVLFASGDPAMAYGERNAPGADMLASCRLDMHEDQVYFLAGDFHHYERRAVGEKSVHVIAGGGGAFLHGTRISPYPDGDPVRVYPDGKMTLQLVWQVPLKLMAGRAGLMVHFALALFASMAMGAAERSGTALTVASLVLSAAIWLLLFGVAAAQGRHPRKILAVSMPFGVGLGFLPMLLRMAIPRVVPHLAQDTAVLIAYAFAGSFIFGLYLVAVTVLGFEHQQAFTVLGHPGFKHFVRLCVHPDGKIESWVIGKDDMLATGNPELIDEFQWSPAPPVSPAPPSAPPPAPPPES